MKINDAKIDEFASIQAHSYDDASNSKGMCLKKTFLEFDFCATEGSRTV